MKNFTTFLCFVAAFMAFTHGEAFAYMDPGTGSVLVYILTSVCAALLFLFKSLFYKVSSRNHQLAMKKDAHLELTLFSEGKTYWYTFKPIIERLLERGQAFTYLSMDIEDPGLAIENPLMNNRYIWSGSAGFARACAVRTRIMLSTMPNIGTPGYPMPRPQHVETLVHVMHSVSGVDVYHRYALDCYDAVLLAGDAFEATIRKLEKVRGSPEKELTALGAPYLDVLLPLAQKARQEVVSREGTVLVAPTWGEMGSLAPCGSIVLPRLLEAGFTVIFRPHPQSYVSEADIIQDLHSRFGEHPNLIWDRDLDSTASMAAAEVLVSDYSSIRQVFAFLFEKPVVTIDQPFPRDLFDLADLDEASWQEATAHRMGAVVHLDQLDDIVGYISQARERSVSDLAAFREESLVNFGKAGKAVADWAIAKCAGLAVPAGADTEKDV